MVIVDLTLALICFNNQCYPALVGEDTKPGVYNLVPRITSQRGYGGDVLQYDEDDHSWFAIHRVWTLNASEHRQQRLTNGTASDRRGVTKGCVNVAHDVYEKLWDCCSHGKLVIRK